MNTIQVLSRARRAMKWGALASTLSAVTKTYFFASVSTLWATIISRPRLWPTATAGGGNGAIAGILSGLLLGSVIIAESANAVVNVYTSTPALQTDFISMTTTQYLSTLVPSPYFAGTYSLTITGKKTLPPPGNCAPPGTMDTWLAVSTTTLARLTVDLTQLTSDYYVQGWANGVEYERFKNVTLLDNYAVFCSSRSFPAPPGISTTTWKVPAIDTTTCSFVMTYAADFIYSQNFSSPTIVPGF